MLALLCGGQGRISAEMFDLVAARPEAEEVFAAAARLLGSDPRLLVKEVDAETLRINRSNQILSVTAALATHACIADALPRRFAVTGYSVGEMAAWSIAGLWPSQLALQLTAQRAQAMDDADGGLGQLGYIRGLERPAVERLAATSDCAIAIINPGNLFVIGGTHDDVSRACTVAEAAGAIRAALLDVRIASHTGRLAAAVPIFHSALSAVSVGRPRSGIILLAGGDGGRIFAGAGAIAGLAAQIAAPIDWAAALQALTELGVDHILDLGPGHALADMVRGSFPEIRAYAADGFHSIDGIKGWLAGLADAR